MKSREKQRANRRARHATVYSDERIVFKFKNGAEIEEKL